MTTKPQPSNLKYGNHPVWYDTILKRECEKRPVHGAYIHFDSRLEYEVYKILLARFKANQIQHHYTVPILEAFHPFPSIKWEVDFKVTTADTCFFVEAKGIELADYRLKLALLARFNQKVYDRLIVVHSSRSSLQDFAHKIKCFEMHYIDYPLCEGL